MSNKIVDNFWLFWDNKAMIWGKNRIGEKKLKQVERILGMPVQSAFANGGDLPHYVILAFTGPKDAYIVNTKRGYFKQYLGDGKFLLTRPKTKIRVWTPAPESKPAQSYKDAKQVAEEYFLSKGRDFVREIKEAEAEIDRRLATGDPEFDCADWYDPVTDRDGTVDINEYGKNPDFWDIT